MKRKILFLVSIIIIFACGYFIGVKVQFPFVYERILKTEDLMIANNVKYQYTVLELIRKNEISKLEEITVGFLKSDVRQMKEWKTFRNNDTLFNAIIKRIEDSDYF